MPFIFLCKEDSGVNVARLGLNYITMQCVNPTTAPLCTSVVFIKLAHKHIVLLTLPQLGKGQHSVLKSQNLFISLIVLCVPFNSSIQPTN